MPKPPVHSLALLLIYLLAVGVMAAETPGELGLTAGNVAVEGPGTGLETGPGHESLLRTVEQYNDAIRELETAHGPYDSSIGEQLVSLGLAYRELGMYKESIGAFERAMHISRINLGLYNENLLDILETVIETNTRFADWEALEKHYNYLYWINQRLLGDDDPRLLAVIDRLGRWQLHAYDLGEDDVQFRHLLAAEDLFEDAVKIIEKNYGDFDPRLIGPLFGLAFTNYKIALHANSTFNFDEMRVSTLSSSRYEAMLEEEAARQEFISSAYRGGKAALEQVVDIYTRNSDLPVDAYGIALTHLADWYVLFNRRSSAAETYELAYKKLLESGMQQADIDSMFGEPRSLPALNVQLEYSEGKPATNYVIARFDVNANGRAENIEIIEAQPADNDSMLRRARSTLRSARFRPRIEGGQPVATAGVNIKYVFQD